MSMIISPEEADRIAKHIKPHDVMALIGAMSVLIDIFHREGKVDPAREATARRYEHMLSIIRQRGLNVQSGGTSVN